MTINYNILNILSKEHGTSFYIFYPERFKQNLNIFSETLSEYYENSQLAYAFKANYMPVLGAYLKKSGYWGEVVSGMEYDIARLFLPADKLVFNGPCKTSLEMNKALKEGAILNLDSFYEIDLLSKINENRQNIRIGLRVNFDIGVGESRFGFNFENGAFSKAVEMLNSMEHVTLTSIHSHFTTRERSLNLFEKRAKGMLHVYESITDKDKIEYLNLGGGFFGPLSEQAKKNFPVSPPTFEEYARLIGQIFHGYFGADGPTLIVEPGISMIANAMDFVVKVLDFRDVNGKCILTADGSVNNLFPTGFKYQPDYSVFSLENRDTIHCDIAGYTCMEHDILVEGVDMAAGLGDYIVFHNRGAYSNVYKPPFIKSSPPIVGVDGKVFSRRQTFEDVIATYSMSGL